jgi:4-diphosphocytidyl-2-C-methyl-D-erythritol kinase
MIAFPNCKINLGLHITEKREDGYHNLQTIFYPIPWKDIIELVSNKWAVVSDKNNSEFRIQNLKFHSSGLPIPGDSSNNLCIKAWELLKQDFPQLPPVYMHLHKVIPMGAGLGGGSADGAFVLKMLNEKFSLNLTPSQLIPYALALGSDCPFFIYNEPCYATSRGEILEPITLDLSEYKMVLINPGIHISTKWAFEQIIPQAPAKDLREIISLPITGWKHILYNDFEAPAIKANPIIGNIKEDLYNDGAIYASMTGSGSTLYAMYPKNQAISLNFPANYLVKEVEL